MGVSYRGNKLIPAPFCTWSREFNTAEDGRQLGSVFVISLQGKITSEKGSPSSSGTWWTVSGYPADETLTHDQMLKSQLHKKKAIEELFSVEGGSLEIQPWDGSAPVKFYPRIRRTDHPAGLWFNQSDYTISMEADVLYLDGQPVGESTYPVQRANEEWSVEPQDEDLNTFRLTHSVSAVGKRSYDENGLVREAVENARLYALNSVGLGIDSTRMEASGVLNLWDQQAYNYVRGTREDSLGGSFSCTESWLLYNASGQAPALETFQVQARLQPDGLTQVSVDGQVQGLEQRDNTTRELVTSKWANAQSKWTANVQPNLFTRAQNLTGITLHSAPLSTTVGYNQVGGVISYAYSYDDRGNYSTAGALSEIISLTDVDPGDVFAAIGVIGRPAGPVLQDIGSQTEKRRSLSIEIQMPAATQSLTYPKPDVAGIVAANAPTGVLVFQEPAQENWSSRTGRYSKSVSWVYE